jgi:hypothetical protein
MARVAAGAFGFLIFSHAFDGPRPVRRIKFLGNNSLKAKLADGFKHFHAIA